MSEIPEAAVEAVLGTQHIQDHLGGSIDADDVRSILEAAMPAIRQQVDAQPEVIDAWYALVDHEAFTPCRDEEAPLLDSMLDRLTNLVDIESAVTELRRSSADDEIRADERRRIAEEIRAAEWPTDKAKTEGLDFGYALGRSAGLDIAAQIAEGNQE